MTPKENALAVLHHEKGEWVPIYLHDFLTAGFGPGAGPSFEKGSPTGGMDGFGVEWVMTSSGSSGLIPAPGKTIMDAETIQDWKKIVKFPDIAKFDWDAQASLELGVGDREHQVVEFGSGNGPFERLTAMMGFQEALLAMVLEPEATYEFMDAVAEWKFGVIEEVAKHYHPDLFTNYDDIATERGLFMSPDTYRKMIKPVDRKIYECAKSYGMIPVQHTCGLAEELVDDFIEIGVEAWTSVQPTNDIVGILKDHGDKLTVIGGYDTNGVAPEPDKALEPLIEEVHRCLDTYGDCGSYVFSGFFLMDTLDFGEIMKILGPMTDEASRYAHELAAASA